MSRKTFTLLAMAAALYGGVVPAQQFVYPKAGQSPEQQQRDDYACHQWAVQQTGFDPTHAVGAQTAPPASQVDTGGQVAKGVLRGGLMGAGIGKIADGDAGKAATATAVLGGFRGLHQAEKQKAAAATQAKAAPAGNAQAYQRAKAACLEGRGYVVQ